MDDTSTALLAAERDDAARDFLIDQFLADGFAAHGARCSEEARVKLVNFHPELLVLGELEPAHAHLALLRELRSRGLHDLLVVVLGPVGSESAELRAFEAGCDDHLQRPVSYAVLRAHVRALLRRSRPGRVPRRRIGALEIDALARQVTVADSPLQVSRLEFELLSRLAAEPTRVFTKEELLREVWGYRTMGRTRTLDAHACRLRGKLALAGAPHLIVNTRGVGYRLSAGRLVAKPDSTGPEAAATPAAGNGRAA